MTTPTSTPVPSQKPLDLLYNAEALDKVLNSDDPTFLDRFGNERMTVAGVEAYVGEHGILGQALGAQSGAEAAEAGAEAARDAALIQAGVYVDEPTGRAAVSDGQAFKTQGSGDVAAYEWRRVNSSSSTLIATYPSSAAVAQNKADLTNLNGSFTFAASRNLYNPALAEDGFIYDFTSGAKVTFANGIASGKVPVTEGKTYTFSQAASERGFYPNVSAYSGGAGATYVGMAAAAGGAPVVSGMNLVLGPAGAGATGGRQSVSFTVPVGSGITFVAMSMLFNYVAHVTADFNRIRNSVMFNEGATALPWELYGVSTATIRSERLPEVYQPAATAAPVISAFTVEPQRNLYNKANAVDGQLIAYPTGLNSPYADGMSIGYTPVEAGKTYVAWMGDSLGFHNALPIYCRDGAGAYLGIDHTIGATPGMANPPTGITWVGTGQVTFTIPPGSAIRFVGFMANYSVHNTADFQRVVSSVQVEVAPRTAYQPYSPTGIAVLNPASLPPSAAAQASGLLSVTKSGTDVYVRGSFDSSYDIVQRVSLGNSNNNTVNVMGARKALKAVTDNVTAWNGGTVLAVQGDSSAPLNYNGTYIGANHGAFIVQEATATAHGKTVVDVGSEWADAALRKWYLMRVVDFDKLWFVSENLSVAPAWSFASAINGSSLTHNSGATHSSAITIGGAVTTQLWPCLQAETVSISLDSKTPITADGTYYGTTVDIVDAYNITNPAAVVAYVRSQVGGVAQPSFIHASIAADVRRTITYRYAENGSCTIIDGIKTLNPLTIGYFGATQAEALNYSGKQLWQYIPRVAPKVGTVKTWNFQAQEDISGTFELLTLAAANWTDANNPPDRMAQIVKSAGVADFGMMVGYSPVRSVGVPSVRKTLVNEACFMSALRKQYPKAVNIGPLPAGSYFEIVAFRAYWSAAVNPQASTFAWYRDGSHVIVVADFHQAVSLSPIKLPQQLVGRDVTVVDKSASATVHGNGVVTPDGILVSVSGTYGYVVLKLS